VIETLSALWASVVLRLSTRASAIRPSSRGMQRPEVVLGENLNVDLQEIDAEPVPGAHEDKPACHREVRVLVEFSVSLLRTLLVVFPTGSVFFLPH
jgi:hypothetical protein